MSINNYISTTLRRSKIDFSDGLGGGKIKKLIQRIVIPYFVFSFLLGDRPNNLDMLTTILYGSSKTIGYATGSHLWFLPCYFVSVSMFYLSDRVRCKNNTDLFLKIVIFTVLAYLTRDEVISRCIPKGLPWGLNIAFMGCALIYMGQCIRLLWEKFYSHLPSKKAIIVLLSLLFAFLGLLLISKNTSPSNIAFARYGNILLFITSNFMMTIATILFAQACDNKLFSYYGRYTFPIYAFHLIILGLFVKLFDAINISYILPSVYIRCLLYSILTLITSCVVINPLKKYFPNLIGDFQNDESFSYRC